MVSGTTCRGFDSLQTRFFIAKITISLRNAAFTFNTSYDKIHVNLKNLFKQNMNPEGIADDG